MAVQTFVWNGIQSVGEELKIRNMAGGGSALIKSVYLYNENPYLDSSYLSGYSSSANTFYHKLFPFKFDPTRHSITENVVESNLEMYTLSSVFIDALEIVPPMYAPHHVSPYKKAVFNSITNSYDYFNGVGVTVPFASFPGPFPLATSFYNKPIKNYYRFPSQYALPSYNQNNDEISFKVILTPNSRLAGTYTADLVIRYEDISGNDIERRNKIICRVSNSNISEMDFTSVENISEIDTFGIVGNVISIF